MKALTIHHGKVAPLDRSNVDTDQIIPKQFLKRVERSGFGQYLFYDWRFDEDGNERPEFVLNRPEYRDATILVAGPNFGCGSSREHAPWALQDWGLQVIIAPSFADIFYNNCLKNGLLPVILPEDTVAEILRSTQLSQGLELTVDVKTKSVRFDDNRVVPFPLDAYSQESLLQGLDEIGRTLRLEASILRFEGQEVARINSRS